MKSWPPLYRPGMIPCLGVDQTDCAGPVYAASTAAVAWPSFAAFPSVYPSAALSASLS